MKTKTKVGTLFLVFLILVFCINSKVAYATTQANDRVHTVSMRPSSVKYVAPASVGSTATALLEGEITVAGKTYTIFIPAEGPYQLENTRQRGLDNFLFTNATPVWFDQNGDGKLSFNEAWVSNHPIRFGNQMLEVISISPDGTTLTMRESKAPLGGLVLGERAPEFRLVDQNGGVHTLERYRGKYLILDLWSTTCAPCIRALPKLLDLQQAVGEDKLQVLLLNIDISWGFADAEERNKATLQRVGVPFPNVLVPGGWGEVLTLFNMHGYGKWLINPEGIVVANTSPGHNMEQIYQILNFTPKTTDIQE